MHEDGNIVFGRHLRKAVEADLDTYTLPNIADDDLAIEAPFYCGRCI
jgi:hypothetical protein